MKKIFAFIFIAILLITPVTVSAQFGKATDKLKTVAGGTGLTPDFEGSVSTIIIGVLSLAGTIFLVLTVYAGILWMTAQGKEEQVTKAKDIVMQAIIGLAITLAAYAITAFVTGKLNPSTPTPTPAGKITTAAACKAATGVCVKASECVAADNLKSIGTCDDTTQNLPICCQ